MKRKYVSAALLIIAVVMISAGIYENQPDGVFSKAVKVCLECVGIG